MESTTASWTASESRQGQRRQLRSLRNGVNIHLRPRQTNSSPRVRWLGRSMGVVTRCLVAIVWPYLACRSSEDLWRGCACSLDDPVSSVWAVSSLQARPDETSRPPGSCGFWSVAYHVLFARHRGPDRNSADIGCAWSSQSCRMAFEAEI